MTVPHAQLAPGVAVPRVIVGAWQLSAGHSASPPDKAAVFDAWARLVDRGFTTFDCADIYRGVEELLGQFRRSSPRPIRVHTKLVPDRDALPSLDRAYLERIVDRSLTRLGVERLDLVQFHWWDYGVPGWVDAMGWLADLVAAGKIRHLGVTNFDVPRLAELLAAGVPVVSHQLQYSVLDRRPERGMAELCRRHGVAMLCYGTVAGGFLSERWLGAAPPPDTLENRSLVKYRLVIEECGGWTAFQGLLAALGHVARRHGVDVASVASRWVLDRPGVTAAIVGARSDRHLAALERLMALQLTEADRRELEGALESVACPAGDVYDLERDPAGPHAAIMRYGLNRDA